MKTTMYHPQAETMEKVKRFLFFFQLAFVCFILPALFIAGVRGNEHAKTDVPATEQIYRHSQNSQAMIDFRPLLSNKQG